MKWSWIATLAALALAGAAHAQGTMQAQPPTAQVTQQTRPGASCLALAGHTYVVELTGQQGTSSVNVRSLMWMRFQPDGTGNGTDLTYESGLAGPRSFTIQCAASAGWSEASPMQINVSNATSPVGSGGVPVNGQYKILIAEGGARFAITNTNQGDYHLAGWGVRQH